MTQFFAPGGGNANITAALSKILADTGVGDAGLDTTAMPTADKLYSTLDPVRRAAMARDLGQMEEEFGVNGLAGSTSLYESGARAQTESQEALLSEVTKMIPQLESVRTDRINAGTARDQMKRSGALDASQLLASIPMGVAGAGMDLATKGFQLGEGERQIADLELQRQFADFVRTNELWPQILAYLSGTPQPSYGPSTLDSALDIGTMVMSGAVAAGGGGKPK
jgi:hypothetical protein